MFTDGDRVTLSGSTRLLITRHGETPWNRQGLIQGHQPVPLSHEGRLQALALRRRLANTPLVAVYCSDLRRAVETADIITEGRDVRTVQLAGLRECGYGQWEGLSSFINPASGGNLTPSAPRRHRVGQGSTVPHPQAAPGGETLLHTLHRFVSTINEIVSRHRDQTVLIVSHDGPVRAWFSQLLGWNLDRCWDIDVHNCGLSEVEVTSTQARLIHFEGRMVSE